MKNKETIIETKRLELRKLNESDYEALAKILQDEEVMYAYEHAFSECEVQEWLTRQITRYQKDGFGLWAVLLKDTKEMIGQCGLTKQPVSGCEVIEVGYLFQKKYWHQGYATEAAIACKEYAFTCLHATKVYSIIRDTNDASIGVAMRNGMKLCDKIDKYYYGMIMPHLVYQVGCEDKLSYRPLKESDDKHIYQLTSDEEVVKYMRFDTHKQLSEARSLLQEYLNEVGFAILVEGRFIGVFVFKRTQFQGEYSMSIFLDKNSWNKGYSSQILADMVAHARYKLYAKKLIGYVVKENIGSRKILQKNGFRETQMLHFPDMSCGLVIATKMLED